MKKLALITAMALSMTFMAACGNDAADSEQNTTNQEQKQETEDTSKEDTENKTDAENETQEEASDHTEETAVNDDTQEEEKTEAEDAQSEATETVDDVKAEDETENNSTDAENTEGNTDSKEQEEKEPIETGEMPDFKVNKKGYFNGKYEGDDGCIYEFDKKGNLNITSDTETIQYLYSLSGNVLSLIAADGSMGTSRQITLLEDGTYLYDDCMGTQVVLTYVK